MLEYINEYASYQKQVTILDRIMGNVAALLSVEAAAKEVYSPLGSELAASTIVHIIVIRSKELCGRS